MLVWLIFVSKIYRLSCTYFTNRYELNQHRDYDMNELLHPRKQWGVITLPRHKLLKLLLNSGCGWVITSHTKHWCNYLSTPLAKLNHVSKKAQVANTDHYMSCHCLLGRNHLRRRRNNFRLCSYRYQHRPGSRRRNSKSTHWYLKHVITFGYHTSVKTSPFTVLSSSLSS